MLVHDTFCILLLLWKLQTTALRTGISPEQNKQTNKKPAKKKKKSDTADSLHVNFIVNKTCVVMYFLWAERLFALQEILSET